MQDGHRPRFATAAKGGQPALPLGCVCWQCHVVPGPQTMHLPGRRHTLLPALSSLPLCHHCLLCCAAQLRGSGDVLSGKGRKGAWFASVVDDEGRPGASRPQPARGSEWGAGTRRACVRWGGRAIRGEGGKVFGVRPGGSEGAARWRPIRKGAARRSAGRSYKIKAKLNRRYRHSEG